MSSNGTDNPPTPAPSSPQPPSNPPSSADVPPSSPPAPEPSTPAPPPASSQAPPPPPPASSAPPPPPPASSAPPPAASSKPPPVASSRPPPPPVSSPVRTVTAPSAEASKTVVQTILVTPTPSRAGETPEPSTLVITVTGNAPIQSRPPNAADDTSSSAKPSSTDPTQLQGAQKDSSTGLSTGGKTAIAVVIPLVVVALLVLGALFFWRKRKQRKNNEDERRKEVEEYGFNPNHDPTLPAVGMAPQMAEDSSGYRGWGNTATSSGRKASTTLTSGMTYSDSNSNPGGYASPHSPTHAYSDANSNDPLVNGRRETLDADGIAALGAAPNATHNNSGVARGPSNASSSYSAANHSDNSGDYPGMGNNQHEYYDQNGYGSYQEGPYGGPGAGGQPIIRDVSARRNTRIENPSVYPQGNSGVATNF